ncbi:MAG: flagellin lysine-N-methylase, partial [Oscillospiraceae bacterium]|nr:flagellin lysine-N-methylase [Oscillospiraceae bacterium]
MILRMPSYCRDFRCSAGECSDSCCIGWEIDIDDKTAGYYMDVKGEFGEKLRNNIQKGSPCSFILQNERCPFLNENNLCEIILNIGEDKLCHI